MVEFVLPSDLAQGERGSSTEKEMLVEIFVYTIFSLWC